MITSTDTRRRATSKLSYPNKHSGLSAILAFALLTAGCSQPARDTRMVQSNTSQKYQTSMATIEQFAASETQRLARSQPTVSTPRVTEKWVRVTPEGRPVSSAASSSSSGDAVPELQDKLVAAINAKRSEFGLPSLRTNSQLMNAAQGFARKSARNGDISHIETNGTTPGDRARAAGYNWRFIAENLAAGQDTIPTAIEDWMNSPSHREALLSNEPVDIGVGHYTDPSDPAYQQYWVMLVGTPL